MNRRDFIKAMGVVLSSVAIAGLTEAESKEFIQFRLEDIEPNVFTHITLIEDNKKNKLYINSEYLGEVKNFIDTLNIICKSPFMRNSLLVAEKIKGDKAFSTWVKISDSSSDVSTVRVWNRALTQDDIAYAYEHDTPRERVDPKAYAEYLNIAREGK